MVRKLFRGGNRHEGRLLFLLGSAATHRSADAEIEQWIEEDGMDDQRFAC